MDLAHSSLRGNWNRLAKVIVASAIILNPGSMVLYATTQYWLSDRELYSALLSVMFGTTGLGLTAEPDRTGNTCRG